MQPILGLPWCPYCHGTGWRHSTVNPLVMIPCNCPDVDDWRWDVLSQINGGFEAMVREDCPIKGKRGEQLWVTAKMGELLGEGTEYFPPIEGSRPHHKTGHARKQYLTYGPRGGRHDDRWDDENNFSLMGKALGVR